MPYIKDSFSILAECAAIDLAGTDQHVRESDIISTYSNIQEISESYYASPEMVPVIKIDNEYFTETSFLAPFMRDNNVKSISEALDYVAEANNLPPKSVGLLIESKKTVTDMIGDACKKNNSKARDNAINKLNKATDLVKNLKDKGYPCKRKKK